MKSEGNLNRVIDCTNQVKIHANEYEISDRIEFGFQSHLRSKACTNEPYLSRW